MRALTLTYILLLAPLATAQLPTTHQDFIQPGTQPSTLNTEIVYSTDCFGCHGYIDIDEEPYRPWTASMMAQSTRDPIFHACLAIAEQDAPHSGDLCLRCHAPGAWLAGRSVPSDGTGLVASLGDFDGVSCNLCHRMVDPVYSAENPAEDPGILAAISSGPGGGTGGMIPTEPHTGQFVIDPEDRRRGPYNLVSMFFHQWRESPYHRESKLCSTCHDVSNPAFTRSSSGSYDLNAVDTEHPTHLKGDEFPIERTYSEWSQSEYAVRPVDTGGLFGGNQPEVSSCQDCHMPKTEGYGCRPDLGGNFRTDLGQHHFNGANSWVLDAVRTLYSDNDTGLSDETVAGAHARTTEMMQNAGEIRAFERNGELIVRVKNETGHKLPTGYHEGRRMWVNVQYLDVNGNVIDERGAYDLSTATLSTNDTIIYEARYGLDSNMSAVTGLPAGESFHFALNNTIIKDNRIPPRGFTLDGFTSVQAAPVGTNYPEHHYWHDSNFSLNSAADAVTVKLYHQTTTREYIEFLRDENTTNNAGQVAYDQWVLHGESEPQLMDQTTLYLGSGACPPPIIFGIGKTTSAGKEPRLSWNGTPSATSPFYLQLDDLPPNKPVLGFWSTTSNDAPFFGGTLLLKPPVYRLSVTFTDGTGAGSIPVPLTASAIGQERYYQAWFRDPQEVIHKVGLTNALHVDICP